jgi:hypothetical protein
MDKIKNKIEQLNTEAENLINIRNQLNQQFNEIEVRLTQIVGAIKALDDLLTDSIIKEDNKETPQEDKNEKE